ncbi:MAG: molybdate transport system substrate-binding protein [Hyphomicrobiales bacterium]|jgi:molybdate transport system substrate-binding protein|nr:molybdate transport system substrate-binding protein [Hyphomicrobiales bacterium]
MANTIRVLSSLGTREVVEAIAPDFEREHACAVARVYDSSIGLLKRIADGETADVALFTAAALDGIVAQGKVAGRIDVSRSFVGMAVRKGAPRPDIGTPERLKQALLAAKSLAHSKTGASGIYFAGLIDRLGLRDALKAKTIVRDGIVADIAASGEAELAVQQISELMQSTGIDIVGPLPDELQQVTIFSAGVFTGSAQTGLAEAFVASLASPANAALIRAKGMEPA